MSLHSLEAIHYPPSGATASGSSWESLFTHQPSWDDVERAIRRLDRSEYPFIFLHVDPPIEWEQPTHSLNILGGRGEYATSIWLTDIFFCYFDPTRPVDPIAVWETDQGSEQSQQNLCQELPLVLAIAEYFFRTGMAFPSVAWKE